MPDWFSKIIKRTHFQMFCSQAQWLIIPATCKLEVGESWLEAHVGEKEPISIYKPGGTPVIPIKGVHR
jgi:hypothetical protein